MFQHFAEIAQQMEVICDLHRVGRAHAGTYE